MCLFVLGGVARADERPLGWVMSEVLASRRYEAGVSERLLLTTFQRFRFFQPFAIEAGLEGSFFDHWGPNLLGVTFFGGFPNANADLVLSFQHERWGSWLVSENRGEFYLLFSPRPTFSILFGLGLRVPTVRSLTLAQAFNWNSPGGELSLLFRVEGRVIEIGRFWASLLVWNFDRMRLETGDNIHASALLEWHLGSAPAEWRVFALASQGVKGVSGGVLSWAQNQISLGVRLEKR